MAKHDTPDETYEELLIRRIFKQIADNHFNSHKLSPYYPGTYSFDRKLGDDIANYVRKHNSDYYNGKRREHTKK